jgi:hypothetical protein
MGLERRYERTFGKRLEDVYPIEPTDPFEPKARGGGVVVSNPVNVLVSSVCYLG